MPIQTNSPLHYSRASNHRTCATERMCKTFHFGPKVVGVSDVTCTAGTNLENGKFSMSIPLRTGRHKIPTENNPAVVNVRPNTVMSCEVGVQATPDGRLVLESGSVEFSNPIEITNPIGSICPDKGLTGIFTNPMSDFLISAIVDGVQINSDGSVAPKGSVAAFPGARIIPLQKVIEIASKNKPPKIDNDIGRAIADQKQKTQKQDQQTSIDPNMMKAMVNMLEVGGEFRFEANCPETDFDVGLGWLGSIRGRGPTSFSSNGSITINNPEHVSLRISGNKGPCLANPSAQGNLWGQLDAGLNGSGKPDGKAKLYFELATKRLGGTGIAGAIASAASMLGVAVGITGDVEASVGGNGVNLDQFHTTNVRVGHTSRSLSRNIQR